ncbi:MAG: acetyltransferase [Chloroflexota bacterium]|jgi:GNAT superfamily N-acetyltransferase
MDTHVITPEATRAYLERDRDANLVPLGALAYDPVQAHLGVTRSGELAAVALVVDLAANLPDDRPTIMVAADDPDALRELLELPNWPAAAIWTTNHPELLEALERALRHPRSEGRGLCYYLADEPPARQASLVRRITADDADALDLSPCALSPTALRGWLRRGWRVFGAVEGDQLLCHALAAYPIGDTEEVSAVFTAPRARRRGLATDVAGAAAADIVGRGHRAVYVAARSNIASRQVAEGLGMRLMYETWEVEIS